MKLTLPDLRWNVALLNAAAIIFLGALGGMWLWMVDRIDDKFEASGERVDAVSDKVSDLRVDIANQSGDLKAILEKLDGNQPQEGTSGRQARPVHR